MTNLHVFCETSFVLFRFYPLCLPHSCLFILIYNKFLCILIELLKYRTRALAPMMIMLKSQHATLKKIQTQTSTIQKHWIPKLITKRTHNMKTIKVRISHNVLYSKKSQYFYFHPQILPLFIYCTKTEQNGSFVNLSHDDVTCP